MLAGGNQVSQLADGLVTVKHSDKCMCVEARRTDSLAARHRRWFPCFLVSYLAIVVAEDDIDELLKELNMAPAAAGAAAGTGAAGAAAGGHSGSAGGVPNKLPLLGIDPKKIRGDEELRRIFGAGVIEAVDRMEGAPECLSHRCAAHSGQECHLDSSWGGWCAGSSGPQQE